MRLISLFLLICNILSAQSLDDQLYFDQYTSEDGLSQVTVTSIVQDKEGFLWFGTQNGLNRFDGIEFRVFKRNEKDSSSISHNMITTLFCDSKNRIWIGTVIGTISVYEHQANRFKTIHMDTLNYGRIQEFAEDSSGTIWSVSAKYLLKLNPFDYSLESMRLVDMSKFLNVNSLKIVKDELWISMGRSGINRYKLDAFKALDSNFPEYISNTKIFDIAVSKNGDKFFATLSNGLIHYSAEKKEYKQYLHDWGNTNSISSNTIVSIVEDSGYLWLATYSGLNRFDLKTEKVTRYRNQQGSKNGLSENAIFSILKDRQGDIWLGTSLGISKINRKKSVFKSIRFNSLYPDILKRPIVWSVLADQYSIWFTDMSLGLNRFDKQTGEIQKYLNNLSFPENSKRLNEIYFASILQNQDGSFWLGSSGRGLFRFWPDAKRLKRYTSSADKITTGFISAMYMDKYETLWLGGYFGVEYLDTTTGKVDFIKTNDVVQGINSDDLGNLWISTRKGLIYIDTEKRTFSDRYQEIADTLHNSNILTTRMDLKKTCWIGSQSGLIAYNLKTREVRKYTVADGLADDMVYSILVDRNNDLWISTNRGISHFIQNQNQFVNYDKSDGLPANEFNSGASFQDPDGRFYFGSINGILAFNPDDFINNSKPPSVEITSLKLFDKSIPDFKNQSTFQYDENYITLQFAALDYTNPQKNKFRYKLDGFDSEWTESSRPFVIYPNLPAGDFQFIVKAAGSARNWNETGTRYSFVIIPPWWQQTWFYSLSAVFICITLFLLYKHRLAIAKKREIELEEIIRERTIEIDEQARQLKLLDKMKSKFFTNISHEFRTPLTLIIGPLEELLRNSTETGVQKTYQRMIFNAKRLLRLINELLELSRLELGKNQLNNQTIDLIEHSKYIVNSFVSIAEYKQIELLLTVDAPHFYCDADSEKFEMILTNLLANAIKYTDSDGKIEIQISTTDGFEIKVIDNGYGIGAADLPHIFERFYQSDDIDSTIEGSGIGLSIVDELVTLMSGNIRVESERNYGTCFTLHFSFKECGPPATNKTINIESLAISSDNGKADVEKAQILIAEDNDQLLDYISEQFYECYSVIKAKNGTEALNQAREFIPDIIISDLMMPELNGLQLAKQLRDDLKTSHIPIIILTAKAENSEKLSSLAAGIDEFMIKPFNSDELQARVENLLEQRRRLKEIYQNQFMISSSVIDLSSGDQQFIQKVIALCDASISNSAFSVAELAEQTGLSRKQLHRKLTALIDMSPNRFIRLLRLKKARLLVESNHSSISEIAFSVGFESLSYFSKCYKEEFGYLPSEFDRQV